MITNQGRYCCPEEKSSCDESETVQCHQGTYIFAIYTVELLNVYSFSSAELSSQNNKRATLESAATPASVLTSENPTTSASLHSGNTSPSPSEKSQKPPFG